MRLACLVLSTISIAHGACEAWCTVPCAELNGDVTYECDSCTGTQYACRPGAPGYQGGNVQQTVQEESARAAIDFSGSVSYETATSPSSSNSNVSSTDDLAGFDGSGADELSCLPYARTIGEGDRSVSICPILNGIWTSFLDGTKWGRYDQPLPAGASSAIAREMRLYDAVGLGTWIGEDFDARVLSALKAHSDLVAGEDERANAKGGVLPYSIIVESGRDVLRNLDGLESMLGRSAVRWVQLGPPALEHLAAYADGRTRGLPGLVGVEDFSADMLRRIGSALPVATAQQEINAIVRPSAATLAACRELGCRFVAYGPLLGGLLSDAYLGVPRPTPDADHTKQWDYLASIDAWADWQSFQRLLQVMRGVGEVHGGLPIATVALAYVLQLEGVVAAIVGVRLGLNGASTDAPDAYAYHRRHRRATLEALRLRLTPEDLRAIDGVVQQGKILDGLART